MAFEMSMRSTILALAFTTITCLVCPVIAAQPKTEQEQVVETVRLMYVALTNDDMIKFRAVTSPDLYIFDLGMRMTGDQLIELVKSAHTAGKVYVWQVTEPQIYVDGRMAWITYVNRGSIQDARGKKDLSWLESAVLRKDNDTWRIQFFHSTKVPSE